MVGIFSGFGESSSSWANGLNDLERSVQTACPRWKVKRYAHNVPLEQVEADEAAEREELGITAPGIYFGHSFGGCTAVRKARRMNDQALSCILVLYDPVWWGDGGQEKKENQTITLPRRVAEYGQCKTYLREGFASGEAFPCGFPIHFQIDPNQIDGTRIVGYVVSGVDHNTIVQSGGVRSAGVIIARDAYRRWLKDQTNELT